MKRLSQSFKESSKQWLVHSLQVGAGGEDGAVRGGDATDLAEDGRGQDDGLGLLQRRQQKESRGELSGKRSFLSPIPSGLISHKNRINLGQNTLMIHGSGMIAVSRLRGKSSHSSPSTIAEIARDFPGIPKKVLPHVLPSHRPISCESR